jgi:hypothetical protein
MVHFQPAAVTGLEVSETEMHSLLTLLAKQGLTNSQAVSIEFADRHFRDDADYQQKLTATGSDPIARMRVEQRHADDLKDGRDYGKELLSRGYELRPDDKKYYRLY